MKKRLSDAYKRAEGRRERAPYFAKRVRLYLSALLAVFILAGACLHGCVFRGAQSGGPDAGRRQTVQGPQTQKEEGGGEQEEASLIVYFLDVGQADCTLAESDGHFMLVDAGNNDDAEMIVHYLRELGVKKLDYVIGTHPHEDHIGAMDAVIDRFDVGAVIMPEKEYDSKSYLDVLESVEKKGLAVARPVFFDEYTLGEASFTVVAPAGKYEDLNNSSAGIRLTDGKSSFLICGDAQREAEEDMCECGINLRADVYKVNHHGSNTSSKAAFLEAVSPRYAVVSCGKDNEYGFPSKKVMNRFKRRDMTVYRTDELGSITASCADGDITFSFEDGKKEAPGRENGRERLELTYILNRKTKKFHRPDCSGTADILPRNYEESHAGRQELIEMGYAPCKRCNP